MSAGHPHPEVDVAPLREAFERSGLTLGQVADRLDWVRPDHSRVARALGLYTDRDRRQRRVTYELAVRLCEAIGIDPVDGGC